MRPHTREGLSSALRELPVTAPPTPLHTHSSSTVPLLPWNTHSSRKLLVQLLPKAQQFVSRLLMGLVTQITPHNLFPASQDCGMQALKLEIQLSNSEIPLGDKMGQSKVLRDSSASALLPSFSMTGKKINSLPWTLHRHKNHLNKLSH